jgi:aquaporin Z
MPLSKRLTAEFTGTPWLVFGGCGSAVLATAYPTLGIQFFGVAFAFGLTVLTGAYALGHISGAHFNPAVSIGLWAAKRFPAKELPLYILVQVLGAIAACGLIYLIANGKAGFSMAGGFAANGFGNTPGSPGNYTALAAFIAEVVTTFFFLVIILGATSRWAPKGFAPLAIGLCLTLIHLVTIPVTSTSVNPARSTGPAVFLAIFGSSWAIEQLWLFWVAPILGALLAGFFYMWLAEGIDAETALETARAEEPPMDAAADESNEKDDDKAEP